MIEYVLVLLVELHEFDVYSMTEAQINLTREECYVLAEKINTDSNSTKIATCIPFEKKEY